MPSRGRLHEESWIALKIARFVEVFEIVEKFLRRDDLIGPCKSAYIRDEDSLARLTNHHLPGLLVLRHFIRGAHLRVANTTHDEDDQSRAGPELRRLPPLIMPLPISRTMQ